MCGPTDDERERALKLIAETMDALHSFPPSEEQSCEEFENLGKALALLTRDTSAEPTEGEQAREATKAQREKFLFLLDNLPVVDPTMDRKTLATVRDNVLRWGEPPS